VAKLEKKEKTYKFPKSMGACADKLFDLREKRLEMQKAVETVAAEEKALKNHIIDNMDKGDTGAAGKHHRVQVVKKEIPQVREWEKLYPYITRYKAFDLLQRRINTKAVQERLDDGKKVPGVEIFTAVDVSLTKI
jgi:hypothetical protein